MRAFPIIRVLVRTAIALITTLAALIISTWITDGLAISGVVTWIAATVIVCVAALLAGIILPFLGRRKYLRRSGRSSAPCRWRDGLTRPAVTLRWWAGRPG